MLTKVKGRIKRFVCVFFCMVLLFFTFGIQKPILFFRVMNVEEYAGVLIHSFLGCPEVTCRLYEDGSITYTTKTRRRLFGEQVPNKPGAYRTR